MSWHPEVVSIKYFAALIAYVGFVLGFAFGLPQISSLLSKCCTYFAHFHCDLTRQNEMISVVYKHPIFLKRQKVLR